MQGGHKADGLLQGIRRVQIKIQIQIRMQIFKCKVLDEYTDKLYDQFVPEGGKQQRKLLKEEREKIKKEEENAAQVKQKWRGCFRIFCQSEKYGVIIIKHG